MVRIPKSFKNCGVTRIQKSPWTTMFKAVSDEKRAQGKMVKMLLSSKLSQELYWTLNRRADRSRASMEIPI